jgi:hypothetical protein
MTARLIDRVMACVVTLVLAVPPLVPAQTAPPPAPFKAEELDQLAAPLALYPDPLVAQVLMASTYPLEIVQAARFVKENPGLTGEPLAMIGGFALVAFPAQYGVSGVMTFIVNHKGVVYQKDLGPTAMGRGLKVFNPDATWKKT